MFRHTLRQTLSLTLDLTDTANAPQIHLILLPHEFLFSPSQYELTFSKINAWPVDMYARVLPSHLGSESEATKFLNRFLRTEPFFSSHLKEMASSTASSSESFDEDDWDDESLTDSAAPNLFNKHAHSQGLDVEKLYLHAKHRTDHYLLLGIRQAGVGIEQKADDVAQIYRSFPLQIDMQPVLLGVPWSFFQLACLIAAIVMGYFILLRRYHMRLFGIK